MNNPEKEMEADVEVYDDDDYDDGADSIDPGDCVYFEMDEFGQELCALADDECQGADCDQATAQRRCRICGCTEDDCHQCVEKTGEPCHWVEYDLCSACVEAAYGKTGEKSG